MVHQEREKASAFSRSSISGIGDSNPKDPGGEKTCRGHVFRTERQNRYRREAVVVEPEGRVSGRSFPDGSPGTEESFGFLPFFLISLI